MADTYWVTFWYLQNKSSTTPDTTNVTLSEEPEININFDEIKKTSKLWKLFHSKNQVCLKQMKEFIKDMKLIWFSEMEKIANDKIKKSHGKV